MKSETVRAALAGTPISDLHFEDIFDQHSEVAPVEAEPDRTVGTKTKKPAQPKTRKRRRRAVQRMEGRADGTMGVPAQWIEWWPEIQTGDLNKQLAKIDRAASGILETTTARNLNKGGARLLATGTGEVDANDIAVISFGLWGRSLTEARDRIVDEENRSGAVGRATLRGHATRRLVTEIESKI